MKAHACYDDVRLDPLILVDNDTVFIQTADTSGYRLHFFEKMGNEPEIRYADRVAGVLDLSHPALRLRRAAQVVQFFPKHHISDIALAFMLEPLVVRRRKV